MLFFKDLSSVCDLLIKGMSFQLSGLDNISLISNILLTEFS